MPGSGAFGWLYPGEYYPFVGGAQTFTYTPDGGTLTASGAADTIAPAPPPDGGGDASDYTKHGYIDAYAKHRAWWARQMGRDGVPPGVGGGGGHTGPAGEIR